MKKDAAIVVARSALSPHKSNRFSEEADPTDYALRLRDSFHRHIAAGSRLPLQIGKEFQVLASEAQ